MNDAVDDQEGQEEKDQNQVVIGWHGSKRNVSPEGKRDRLRPRNPQKPAGSFGQLLPAVDDHGYDHVEAHSSDGEVRAFGSKGQDADEESKSHRDQAGQDQSRPEIHPSFQDEQARAVGPNAEKGPVGQVDLSRVPHDQVHGGGRHAPDAAHDQDVEIKPAGHEEGNGECQEDQEKKDRALHPFPPNSPVGRMASTVTRTPKEKTSW